MTDTPQQPGDTAAPAAEQPDPELGGKAPPQAEIDALVAALNAGETQRVLRGAAELARKYPYAVDLYNLTGAAYMGARMPEAGLAAFRRAVEIAPRHVGALSNLGTALLARGMVDEAVRVLSAAEPLAPENASIHAALGEALRGLGRLDEAALRFRKALSLAPNNPPAALGLARVLASRTGPESAIEVLRPAAEAYPHLGELSAELGRQFAEAGLNAEAVEALQKATARLPGNQTPWHNLGVALRATRDTEGALAAFERARGIDPAARAPRHGVANCLALLGRTEEATAVYDALLAENPNDAPALAGMSFLLRRQDRHEDALALADRAIAADPECAAAHSARGEALRLLDRNDEARDAFRRTLEIEPKATSALSSLFGYSQEAADWDEAERSLRKLIELGFSADTFPSLNLMAAIDDPPLFRDLASTASQSYAVHAPMPAPARPAARPERLKIGYFSADFRAHAMMTLMREAFEHHDPERFEIHAFSFGPEPRQEITDHLERTFHKAHFVREQTPEEIAELARETGIDLAVDLLGFTQYMRPGIFARRPSAVQINFLGYPGTCGGLWHDYIVATPEIIPQAERENYAESVIALPFHYCARETRTKMPATTRAEVGLPEDAFVFCAFNRTYKITREAFAIWMRLLTAVEGSVLWLIEPDETVRERLRSHARAAGVDPARLVFAERAQLPIHLARQRCADLFLDTFNYGAHTTGSDALFAGLPVLTRRGRSFSSRVSAGQNIALGFPELVAETAEQYEATARELARDREKLADLRARVEAAVGTAPLFDVPRFVRYLEAGYDAAWERWRKGEAPADIDVPA
jgi:predicted O-linked N-acetylglucosamine transferase (SPINDLY family)